MKLKLNDKPSGYCGIPATITVCGETISKIGACKESTRSDPLRKSLQDGTQAA